MFIPTKKSFQIGDEVFLLLNLMEELEKLPIAGKVVGYAARSHGSRASGIGVQFSENDLAVRNKVEQYLVGALQTDRPTHTF